VTAPVGHSPSEPPSAAAPRFRFPYLLLTAIILSIAWWIALGTMALLTAKPVMINREQVLRAPRVVTATVVDDPKSGQLQIKQEWKGSGPSGTISVPNLSAAGAKRGGTYLVPLSRTSDGFEVSRTMLPNAAPLIYPATPEAIEQLKQILSARHT
jgi:hypothetical protein